VTQRLAAFLNQLQDPDMVGESAYRVLHEDIHDITDSCRYDKVSDAETLRLIMGELNSVISWARGLKGTAARTLRRRPGPRRRRGARTA
jgi:hypothetical protein